ncbi:hypothetical protein HZH68_013352 [Vespula germanica]|uniref:Uncharacterized protein n=1 Tax=Vespula germanica TaxID=30212 RepID=A0A834MV00_VESGE|nr:hypothetical protein HZH68_013352 [Vespula germanica]
MVKEEPNPIFLEFREMQIGAEEIGEGGGGGGGGGGSGDRDGGLKQATCYIPSSKQRRGEKNTKGWQHFYHRARVCDEPGISSVTH